MAEHSTRMPICHVPGCPTTDGTLESLPGFLSRSCTDRRCSVSFPRISSSTTTQVQGQGKEQERPWQVNVAVQDWHNCQEDKLLQFFFLRYGRSRSKARFLHENKLLSRKLQHGHRWSHANWQIINTKTQNTTTKRQDADPPARFASHHPKDSKANSERGKSPTETTTK